MAAVPKGDGPMAALGEPFELAVAAASAVKTAGYSNLVYMNPADFAQLRGWKTPLRRSIGGNLAVGVDFLIPSVDNQCPFYAVEHAAVAKGTVEMASPQRNSLGAAKGDRVLCQVLPAVDDLTSVTASIQPLGSRRLDSVDATVLVPELVEKFGDHPFKDGHQVVIRYDRCQLRVTISNFATTGGRDVYGILREDTEVNIKAPKGSGVRVTGSGGTKARGVMQGGFNFEKMGIGGLDAQFRKIFRQAFSSRAAAPGLMREMGVPHARGMLLYGPPGCGKTLIARKLAEALKARPPKIVNGPEVLSKWVGGSEENIRKLFAEAEEEQTERGDESDLHIIIFDEIDAICKQRGSSRDNTGTHDSVVNQLLSKIDGVNSLNNILLIGMTNRMDMIDDALLRPGRLEIHVEIGLPNEEGRLQILTIHTKTMRENNRIDPAIDLGYWADRTKNFTGAEIEGLVKNAMQFALQRHTNAETLTIEETKDNRVMVRNEDFVRGFKGCHPAFGIREDALSSLYRLGLMDYGPEFSTVWASLNRAISTLQKSSRTNMISCLLTGPPGSGKTAVAAKLGKDSGFPFVKRLAADTLVGRSESGKAQEIVKAFQDAYKTNFSVIILDDIEQIMEYVGGGARFSNAVLQTLMVLCRKPPETVEQKLLVIATTSKPDAMSALGLSHGSVFDMKLELERLSTPEHVAKVMRGMAANDKTRAAETGEDESKDHDQVFSEESVRVVSELLTADGSTISIKALLRLLDTLMHMEGTIAERVNQALTHGYSF